MIDVACEYPIETEHERMNIVIAGHVDHGKSTVIGRLLADTNSLSEGKLEQVKEHCKRNSRPFEYAFLLDALKDEQSQGITIDSARCFFKTAKRDYIIIDAPGHIEFLKNMISGASRAEAALLVIDAHEGVCENSKRHGYMLSLLGIKQIAVLINKMDLEDYSEEVFNRVRREYTEFMKRLKVIPMDFIPTSARDGDNIIGSTENMPWYKGRTVLDVIDTFEKEKEREEKPFRMPVQDIYKFTGEGDERRIVAGTVETGSIRVGDEVLFLPSGKSTTVRSIQAFNEFPQEEIRTGYAKGFTLDTQLYIKRGELACRLSDPHPKVSHTFKANIFWLGKKPMVMGKKYKLKINTSRESVFLESIINVIDASELTTEKNKKKIDRHDVAECIFKTLKPIAFDLYTDVQYTGRFVIIDDYEIAGGGIIIQSLKDKKTLIAEHVERREHSWENSEINFMDRAARFSQTPKFIAVTGGEENVRKNIAKTLEKQLFIDGKNVYYLGVPSLLGGLESNMMSIISEREEQLHSLGELARILTDAGLIFITTIPDLDEYEVDQLKMLNRPNEIVIINIGRELNVEGSILTIKEYDSVKSTIENIKGFLHKKKILIDYQI